MRCFGSPSYNLHDTRAIVWRGPEISIGTGNLSNVRRTPSLPCSINWLTAVRDWALRQQSCGKFSYVWLALRRQQYCLSWNVIACSRVLEKLTVPQLVKKLPAFYRMLKFAIVSTTPPTPLVALLSQINPAHTSRPIPVTHICAEDFKVVSLSLYQFPHQSLHHHVPPCTTMYYHVPPCTTMYVTCGM